MVKLTIRHATEQDRDGIASVFAQSFYKDWEFASKDISAITRAIKGGLQLQHFIVAVVDDVIAGFLSYVEKDDRAFHISMTSFKKEFGFFKGPMIAGMIRAEFETPLHVPVATIYIDILGIAPVYQRNGIASQLLAFVISHTDATNITLSVTDVNEAGKICYQKMGFQEYDRHSVKYAKQRGFSEYIYMRYEK